MPTTPFAAKLLLDFMTGAAAATQPSARWISLATASPTSVSPFDGPYSRSGTVGGRQSYNCGAAVSPAGYCTNRSVMSFTATAACTAVGWNLWDGSTAGNRLAYGTLAAAAGVASGGIVTFAASALRMDIL